MRILWEYHVWFYRREWISVKKVLLIDEMERNHDNREINLLVIEICMSRNIKKDDLK